MEYIPCVTEYNAMASDPPNQGKDFIHPDQMASTDVYDHAAAITMEFQKMITAYGKDAVTPLAHKIMRILLQLNNLTLRSDHDSEEISQLRSTVEKLEAERAERAQQKAKFDQEVEAYEEQWKTQVKELVGSVERLQSENKRLRQTMQNEKHDMEQQASARFRETEEQEIRVMTKLAETADKQREELRSRTRELAEKVVECESLQADLDQKIQQNTDLRHKNHTHKKQLRTLLEEKAEMEVTLHQRDAEMDRLKAAMVEREEFEEQKAASRAQQQQQHQQHKAAEVEDGEAEDGNVTQARSVAAETAVETSQAEAASPPPESPGLELEGKVIIDLKDPNRPRFTLHELRQVLLERNELKARLIELEEELLQYRPKEENKDGDISDILNYSGEELPVFGPINREPEEKVIGPKESGIRKLMMMSAVFATWMDKLWELLFRRSERTTNKNSSGSFEIPSANTMLGGQT